MNGDLLVLWSFMLWHWVVLSVGPKFRTDFLPPSSGYVYPFYAEDGDSSVLKISDNVFGLLWVR
jgi:hypothetical protein